MIKNIIFDIGQVLKGWHPERIYKMYDKETADAVIDAIWGTGYWFEMDRGVLSDRELFEKMLACAPAYREQITYVYDHLEEISERMEYAIPWIHEMKDSGYRVYFLSNYSRHLRRQVPQTIDFLPLMDGGIFSSDVQLLKPDPRIYELLCRQYQLTPGECLFLDDSQENVDAAIRFGMHGIRFEGFEKSYPVIMDYLGSH